RGASALSRERARAKTASGQRVGTARAGEALRPVGAVEMIDAHALAARRRMDEKAVVEIDADVRDALAVRVEEHEIAHPERIAVDLAARTELAGRIARQVRAERLLEHVLDEAAAVETGGELATATDIGDVAQLQREVRQRATRRSRCAQRHV